MSSFSASRRNDHQHRNNAKPYAEDASRLIRENMKCPVCLEVLLPPIYQCETGHNICYLCVDEVTECPLCKSDYGDTRNYFAEELVNSMTFPCKYEEYGCHKTFLGSQLKDHQTSCEYQPYRCPELACQEVVGIHQMAKHLDKHGFKVMKGDAHQASIEILDDHFDRKTEYNPWRISAFDVEFYTVSTRSREGVWYFWAYGLGSQKELKKFSYEIVLYSEEKQLMYRGVIQSLRNNPDDIMRNGSCLITTDHVIKSIRKNGRINCQVYFIQGKNWEASRNAVCETNQKTKTSKTKKKKKAEKESLLKEKAYKKFNFPTTVTFTSPQLSTQSSITSQLSGASKSKPRGLNLIKTKSSPMDILKKELDLNGNRVFSKFRKGQVNAGKYTALRTSTATDDENSFVQRVRDTLRCPSCNEGIAPPVFQCLIGHNVCHKCRISRQDCPLCLSPLTDCRNFFAEELLYKTFQRCLYSKHGCKVCLPSAQMKSHEAVCDYAPFECPFNVCRTLLRSDDLLDHMKTHQVVTVNKELKKEVFVPRNAPGAAICIIPNILMVDKVAFYPIIVRENDGNWLFYVITHNYPNYRFELSVKKQNKTLAFQGPVLSLRANYAQVKLNGNGLLVTERAVKGLKIYDKLAYQVKVRKLEEPEGGVGKESTLNLPRSWVLTARSGEIVSKTELFANKKTSVTPNTETDEDDDDDEEEDDDTPVSAHRHRHSAERDTSDATDFGESDAIHSDEDENESFSGTSLANTSLDESEEYETMSTRSQKSKDLNNDMTEPVTITKHSNEHLQTAQSSHTSLASKKTKKVTLPAIDVIEQVGLEERRPSRHTASSTTIATNNSNETPTRRQSSRDSNNNNLETSNRRRMSTESLKAAGSSHSVSNSAIRDINDIKRDLSSNAPVSILKPSPSENRLPKAGSSLSMHSLKIAPEAFGIGSHSSAILSTPLITPEKVVKSKQRSRSFSKHRVRLSDQVICCGATDTPEDVNGNNRDYTCKSQTNLLASSSKPSIRKVPSKHVMSVRICDDDSDKPLDSVPSEFQKLKQAVSKDATIMEEDDLLSVKSINEMTDAVINGSFDVVKSVINLFTSDSPEVAGDTKEALNAVTRDEGEVD